MSFIYVCNLYYTFLSPIKHLKHINKLILIRYTILEEGFLYEKLSVLNTVYNNTIVLGKTPAIAAVIKTPLFPHQNALVNGMHVYRDKMTRGFVVGNQAINGKIGIIGDPAGTGKTLAVLAYLSSQVATFPRITCELTNNSSKYFFSH